MLRITLAIVTVLFWSGCAAQSNKKIVSPVSGKKQDSTLSQEEAQKDLTELGKDIVYGNGIGIGALNLGATYLFPPYGIYVLGNAISEACFDKTFYVTDLLPEKERTEYNKAYDTVTSGPGRLASAVAQEEFRTKDRVKGNLENIKQRINGKSNE